MSFVSPRSFRGSVALALVAAAAIALAFPRAQAQAPAQDAGAPDANSPDKLFTPENLIGDAVSLSNQPYPEIDKAIQRFRNGDEVGAREFVELAKTKYPKLPPIEVTMAKLNFMANRVPQGRDLLEQSVTKYPADPEAYLLLADQAFQESRLAEADALFARASTLVKAFNDNVKRKRNFEIRVLAGTSFILERREQWDQAAVLLKQWLALDPDSVAAHTRYGIVLFRQGKVDEAFKEFAEARKLRPDVGNPNIMLGQLYAQTKDVAKARAAFEKAYAAEKTDEPTARAYANFLIQQDDLDKAQAVAVTLRQQQPQSLNALLLEGLIAKMRGDRKAAEDALMKAIAIDPSNAPATDMLALILVDSKAMADREKALRYAKVNAERFQNNAQAQITLAWVLFQLGRAQEAQQALARAPLNGGLAADSAFLVAKMFAQQGRRDDARGALETILKQTQQGAFTYRREAQALLKELGSALPSTAPGAGPASPPGAAPAPNAGS